MGVLVSLPARQLETTVITQYKKVATASLRWVATSQRVSLLPPPSSITSFDHDGDPDTEMVQGYRAQDRAAVSKGSAQVTLSGAGRDGIATVTAVTQNGVSQTIEITLFGDAKSISAEADQGSIAIGGKTFIVVTVLDGGDNGVAGSKPTVGTKAGEVPEGPAADSVVVEPDPHEAQAEGWQD